MTVDSISSSDSQPGAGRLAAGYFSYQADRLSRTNRRLDPQLHAERRRRRYERDRHNPLMVNFDDLPPVSCWSGQDLLALAGVRCTQAAP
jgi:hypothetical protein